MPNPHSLLAPPALFSKNGQPAEGLCNFCGHGRWCAGLDTSNPAPTLTFPDVAPRPPLLWGVEHREGWEATQTIVNFLNCHGQPGQEEMPGIAHLWEVSAREMEACPPTPTPQQIALRTHCTAPGVTDLACSASLLQPLMSGPWSSENHFQTSLCVFSLSAISIQLLLFLLLTGKLRLKEGE